MTLSLGPEYVPSQNRWTTGPFWPSLLEPTKAPSLARNRHAREMASTYVKEFTVPPEMPEVLRDFTREVLRDQPEDVAKYGYEYFLKKMEEAKAKAEGYAT